MRLEFIRPITWEEIWEQWRKDEEGWWEEHYAKEGFSDWESWRGASVKKYNVHDWEWKLFRVPDPLNTVSTFFVGSFPGWRPYYPDKDHSHFKDIATSKGFIGSHTHNKVLEILKSFPKETQLVGVRHLDMIMVMEGTHRSTAMAYALQNHIPLETKVTIALTEVSKEKWDKVHNKKDSIVIE